MENEIKFAEISKEFLNNLADYFETQAYDHIVYFDPIKKYNASGAFKARIHDAFNYIDLPIFGIAVNQNNTVLEERLYQVLVIAIEEQQVVVNKKINGLCKKETVFLTSCEEKNRYFLPWNYIFLYEIESLEQEIIYERNIISCEDIHNNRINKIEQISFIENHIRLN